MKMYLILQFKRALKLLPLVMTVALALFGGLTVIFNTFMAVTSESENNKRFKIGLCGDISGTYLDIGIAALQNFDSSHFAIETVAMTEDEARKALESKDISAYVVIPEGFLEAALCGEIRSIKYVTNSGSAGLVSMFKEEITSVISALVEESQRGVYGIADALDENGYENLSYRHMNQLNIEYIDTILARNKFYTVDELGISNGLSLPNYIFCGITVLFLFLAGLPYAILHIKREHSLNKVLSARGNTALKQIIAEYLSFFLVMVLLFTTVLAILAAVTTKFENLTETGIPHGSEMLLYALQILPIVALAVSYSFMIFEISGNLITGMLLHFFTCLSLCYISGCLYPLYAFPDVVQKISVFSPTGMALSFLGACLTEESAVFEFFGMAIYFIVFILITVFVRHCKITGKQRWAA